MSYTLRAEIVSALRQGDAIFIVGSGVSMSASGGSPTASWKGLIEAGIHRCVDVDKGLDQSWEERQVLRLSSTDSADLIGVAQEVSDCLSRVPGGHYEKFLAETVGRLPLTRRGILDVLGESAAPILTTNYDDLLERATGRVAVTWDRLADIQSEVRDPGRHIIHLHGFWREPATVVFGYKSYADRIGDNASQALLRALVTVKMVVFLGFGQGLSDPNFAALTTWLTSTLKASGVAPVVLVRDDELARYLMTYRQQGLNAVSYGPDHDDLELFLADIVREVRLPQATERKVFSWDAISPKRVIQWIYVHAR